MARGGVSSRQDAWAQLGGHRPKMCCGAAWPAGVLNQGRAGGRITQDSKMQREGLRKGDCSEYFSRPNTIVQECVQWVPWPGPARRRGRAVSNGGRPPVGCRFHQPDRTPFFRLTPAFGLLHDGRTTTFFPAQKEERRSFRCRSPAQPSMAGRQRPFPSSRGTVSARAA